MVCAPPLPLPPDDLNRSHDGPPPRHAVRVAELGGRTQAEALAREAARHTDEILAGEARLGAARRRSALSGMDAGNDPWLARLTATLAHHRLAAVRPVR